MRGQKLGVACWAHSMTEAVVTALITGGLSLTGVVITCLLTARKSETALKISQAVIDTKIEELTREVRLHNNFARRMPVVESQIENIHGTIRELKAYHKPKEMHNVSEKFS